MNYNTTYPQSSCPSEECGPRGKYHFVPEADNAHPSLLAVPNCSTSLPLKYCVSEQVYRQSVMPPLNVRVEPFSYQLNKVGPVLDKKWYIPLAGNVYAGFNPILYEPVRAQRMLLDRPHYTGEVAVGNVCKDEIYTPYFRKYGKNYTNYEDINGGDVQYWMSEKSAEPYSYPNFITPAIVDHTMVSNPMGTVYPEYRRLSMKQYDWDKCNQDSCDSYTHDSLEFRQELMEAQSRKRNQQEYGYRWAKH